MLPESNTKTFYNRQIGFNSIIELHFSFVTEQIDAVITKEAVLSTLRMYGDVHDLVIKKQEITQNPRCQSGYGFAAYASLVDVLHTIRRLKGEVIDSVEYDCQLAKRSRERFSSEEMAAAERQVEERILSRRSGQLNADTSTLANPTVSELSEGKAGNFTAPPAPTATGPSKPRYKPSSSGAGTPTPTTTTTSPRTLPYRTASSVSTVSGSPSFSGHHHNPSPHLSTASPLLQQQISRGHLHAASSTHTAQPQVSNVPSTPNSISSGRNHVSPQQVHLQHHNYSPVPASSTAQPVVVAYFPQSPLPTHQQQYQQYQQQQQQQQQLLLRHQHQQHQQYAMIPAQFYSPSAPVVQHSHPFATSAHLATPNAAYFVPPPYPFAQQQLQSPPQYVFTSNGATNRINGMPPSPMYQVVSGPYPPSALLPPIATHNNVNFSLPNASYPFVLPHASPNNNNTSYSPGVPMAYASYAPHAGHHQGPSTAVDSNHSSSRALQQRGGSSTGHLSK